MRICLELSAVIVTKYKAKKQVVEQPPLRQKQILPHLSLFCLKASHRYDFLPSVGKLKMRISKLGVRESCRSLTLDSHLSWTCERRIWSRWLGHASPLSFCTFLLLFVSSQIHVFFFFHLFRVSLSRSHYLNWKALHVHLKFNVHISH